MPPRHPSIARALGSCRRRLGALRSAASVPGGPDVRSVHVACSGGPDSVALLGLLCLLAPREGLRLSVGHVDHGLRPASADEAALVQRLAHARGEARRAALREQARRQGAAFVALGHTATDQAETMLLHLARGAGLPGLAAMAEHEPWDGEPGATLHAHPRGCFEGPLGGWLRPLLALERDETRALAQRLELPFVDDPTNLDRSHPRVRMRLELLPALRELNPRVEAALARTAEHARQAEEALQQWVDRELRARRCPADLARDAPAHAIARPYAGVARVTSPASSHQDAPAGPDRSAVPDPGVAPARPSDLAAPEPAAAPVTSAPRWSTEGMAALPAAVRTRFVRRVCQAAGAPDDALAASTLASIDDALLHPGPRRAWDLHPWLRLCIAHGELWTEGAGPAPDPAPGAASRATNH